VLTNDTAAVKELFEQHKTFEFTARALGFASRYCGAAMVRTLVENGATFSYTATPAFKTKYDCSVAISNSYSFAFNYVHYLFPAYEIKNETRTLISDEERISVLRVWHEKNACNFEELLYLAILHQDDAVYTELQALGITKISQERKRILSGEKSYTYMDAYERYDRGDFYRQLINSSDISAKTMLERALSTMGIKKLLLFPGDFYEYDYPKNKFFSRYCSPVLFDFFLNKTNMLDRVKKSELLYALIDEGNAEGLGYAFDEKWVEKEKDINELLLYAREKENISPAVLALLMDKQNKNASPIDFDKAFSLTPSAADLKKIWSTKKRESDGTLIITSYKGTETDVTIPAKIGKTDVTEIASDAFDPMAPRLTEMQRKARSELCSVTFPETITKIPQGLFAEHSQLKIVTLGEKTKEIGKQAFSYTGLEEIILPNSIRKIDDWAFLGCSKLKTINLPKNLISLSRGIFQNTGLESFDVPEHITEIGAHAFSECEKLKTLTLHENIKKIPSDMVSGCPRLRKFKIPENVASIGAGAFEDCKALAKIDLPAHTAIGDRAFSGCKLLANDNGEILLNGTFFGFTGDESE
ncbi:MAG: leucine-rich repeat domain-containing protein, partial [Clostridia bacterium]|nr:leucine-rich repeat domain-containing protein [Clostridia bacterium]